jgi:hypothetical protein
MGQEGVSRVRWEFGGSGFEQDLRARALTTSPEKAKLRIVFVLRTANVNRSEYLLLLLFAA